MTKKFFVAPIKAYQYISAMLPPKCRYYPSCSEYATWQFETTNPASAFFNSSLRILRCNQFFRGGIDYPVITYRPKVPNYTPKINNDYGTINIKYWLVPKEKNYYYVIKDLQWKSH